MSRRRNLVRCQDACENGLWFCSELVSRYETVCRAPRLQEAGPDDRRWGAIFRAADETVAWIRKSGSHHRLP